MKQITDLNSTAARKHLLKGVSYFNVELPNYISFEPILNDVASVMADKSYSDFKKSNPKNLPGVNYDFISNKDGRFAWRPYEMIHPVLYVSLVNLICQRKNWKLIKDRLAEFENGAVDCCGIPVVSTDKQSDKATQITSWWQKVEQQSIIYSLEFSHILHTDVTDCYGSLYTHSIPWALHGMEKAKSKKADSSLIGNNIDQHIQAGRYGQTNGIPQGSVLMDLIAEIVLGYVDEMISEELSDEEDFKILRYRDDYRIFANSDRTAEHILKVVSDKLRTVGMKLGASKTTLTSNVVEGSIKPDKLAAIELHDLGTANAKTVQKQLLRLHAFGRKFPNSGAMRRLVGEFLEKVAKRKKIVLNDLEAQVAIATDIAIVSPLTFPAVAGILSHLISYAPRKVKRHLWKKVRKKMSRVPYNGYLEIWLQRVVKPKSVNLNFKSDEAICQVVNGKSVELWDNSWISSKKLLKAIDTSKIVISQAADAPEKIAPKEVDLYLKRASYY